MTDQNGNPPQGTAGDGAPNPPEDNQDPAPTDDFAPLPRKRFWRGGRPRAAAIDPWWRQPDESDPED